MAKVAECSVGGMGRRADFTKRRLHEVHQARPSAGGLGRDYAASRGGQFYEGRIIVRGKMVRRGVAKRADYILYYKPHIPLAVIEAKDNNGLEQALEYAETLKIPFVLSSNGDGFVFHDGTKSAGALEQNLTLEQFPSPAVLWSQYREWKGLPPESHDIVLQDYYTDGSDKNARYYQASAVNARPKL